jgi:DNA-binding GntR family transcriptional regulator
VADQHERLYRALEARDADAACAALIDYMRDLRRQYAKAQESRTRAVAQAGPRRRA